MKASRVTYSSGPNEIMVTMSEGDTAELMHQMKAFWENVSIHRQPPSGNSPFARLYEQIKRLGEVK